MNQTPNLKLYKPEGEDPFEIAVINQNMDILDGEVKALKTESGHKIGDIVIALKAPDSTFQPCNGEGLTPSQYDAIQYSKFSLPLDEHPHSQRTIMGTFTHNGTVNPEGAVAVGPAGWKAYYNTVDRKIHFSQDNFITEDSNQTVTKGTTIWFAGGYWISIKITSTGIVLYYRGTALNSVWAEKTYITASIPKKICSCKRIVYNDKTRFVIVYVDNLNYIGDVILENNFTLFDTSQCNRDTFSNVPTSISSLIPITDFYIPSNSTYFYQKMVGITNSKIVFLEYTYYNAARGHSCTVSKLSDISINANYHFPTIMGIPMTGEYYLDHIVIPGYSSSNTLMYGILSDIWSPARVITCPDIPCTSSTIAMIVPFNRSALLITSGSKNGNFFQFYISNDLADPFAWRKFSIRNVVYNSTTVYPRPYGMPIVWNDDEALYISCSNGSSTYGFIKIPYVTTPYLNQKFDFDVFFIKTK